MIKKLLLTVFLVINLFFASTAFGQLVGDYRSVATGNWTTLSSWERWDGSSWSQPSVGQGYPGQNIGTGTVTILNGNTITLTNSITNLFTKLIIGDVISSGVFTVGADIANFNTLDIIINPKGNMNFTGQNELKLPANSGIKIYAPGQITTTGPGTCTNNTAIYIGGIKFGVCKGEGNAEYTFAELNSFGGTLFSTPSSNTPVCQGGTINLVGSYSGPTPTSITYSWSVKAPDNSVTTSSTTNQSLTAAQIGTYQATLTCNALYDTRTYSNSETIFVVVNALPSIPTITAGGPTTFCAGGSVTLTSSLGTAYSWSNGATTQSISPTASGSYTVQVTNSSGCQSASSAATTVTVNALNAPTVGTRTHPTCAVPTGSVVLNDLPASGTWTLTRSPGGVTTLGTGTSTTISGLAAGTYTYTVTNASGCLSPVSTPPVLINAFVEEINTWNGSAWSTNLPPTAEQKLVFEADYSQNIDIVGCSCQVNALTDVIIKTGRKMTITNGVSVDVDGFLTFENDASLVQINNTPNINNGEIDYIRTTDTGIYNTDYVYWSSPVEGMTLGKISKNLTLPDKYYSYEPTLNGEDWKQESSLTPMVSGNGYIIRGPESSTQPGNNYTALFTGVPHNGHYEITPIFANKSYLLGNPYPSALDADTFLANNADVLNGTLYFWTHNTDMQARELILSTAGSGAYAYTSNDYATYNATGGVGASPPDPDAIPGGATVGPTPRGDNNANAPTGKIASGQGFFASTKINLTGTKIVFDNDMRVGVIDITKEDNSQFFKTKNPNKSAKTIEKNRIWLNLTNTQAAFKQTLVGYITDATNEYDDRFDGESFDGNEFVDFYSVNQDKNLTIQGRALPFDENDEVPLGFRTTINGAFTINIDQVDGLLTNQAVFIEDKLTNTVTDLKRGNYTFNTAEGTFNDRFVLKYTNKTLSLDTTDKEDGILAFYSNNYKTLIIKNNLAEATVNSVALFNMLGQKIENWDVSESEQTDVQIPIKNMSSGIYVVKIKTTKGESSKKIIVN